MGTSISGGWRWFLGLLRLETVWALDLLSGNIFWLSEINPDVWVRTAPAGFLRKQCISTPIIIYMQQQSLGSAGMGMKLRLFFVKAYKITEDWFFYMKKRFIFESSCSITLEGDGQTDFPLWEPSRAQNYIETTDRSCIYVNIWSILRN